MDTSTLVLLGHNGAGKSTLIRHFLGYYRRESDHPFLKTWRDIQPLDRRNLGFVPELPWLDAQLTGREQFQLMAGLKSCRISWDDMAHLTQRVGLDTGALDHPVSHYSKGMKQRLLIALALINEPMVLLLDEPLSGLDPFGHEQIMSLLLALKADKHLIVSTHQLDDAWKLADQIWVLQNGLLVFQGPRPESADALSQLYFRYPPHGTDSVHRNAPLC